MQETLCSIMADLINNNNCDHVIEKTDQPSNPQKIEIFLFETPAVIGVGQLLKKLKYLYRTLVQLKVMKTIVG